MSIRIDTYDPQLPVVHLAGSLTYRGKDRPAGQGTGDGRQGTEGGEEGETRGGAVDADDAGEG